MCLPVKPFSVEREWIHAGLQCAVVQAHEGQFRCGYVRVPPAHPAHGKSYDDVAVEVHGGLSFGEEEPCEHGDGRGFWFGFDCCHAWDARFDPAFHLEDLPPHARRLREFDRNFPSLMEGHFWTQPEVEAETERLAEQLAALSA